MRLLRFANKCCRKDYNIFPRYCQPLRNSTALRLTALITHASYNSPRQERFIMHGRRYMEYAGTLLRNNQHNEHKKTDMDFYTIGWYV